MNYEITRWECDRNCDEIEDTEGEMPLGWDKFEGEELCPDCLKDAKAEAQKRDA